MIWPFTTEKTRKHRKGKSNRKTRGKKSQKGGGFFGKFHLPGFGPKKTVESKTADGTGDEKKVEPTTVPNQPQTVGGSRSKTARRHKK